MRHPGPEDACLHLELPEPPRGSGPAARPAPQVRPETPAGQANSSADQPTRGEVPYRVAMVSVRSDHYYLLGAAGCFDLDQPPPAGVGQTYASIQRAQDAVRRDLATLTVFWQFRILDATGTVVATGFRAGPNGTGTTIGWRA